MTKKKWFVLMATVLLAVGLMAGAVGAEGYVFPSTNDLNRDQLVPGREGQVVPYVNLVSAGADYVELEFVNGSNSLAFFEYRIDGEIRTSGTAHPVVLGDFIYPGVGVDGRGNPETLLTPRTFNANEKVEIRLALGGERDWDFNWTTFYTVPEIKYEAAPAVANRLLKEAGVNNRYGRGRTGGNYIADVARHAESGGFEGVSSVFEYEYAIADFLNNTEGYPAGVAYPVSELQSVVYEGTGDKFGDVGDILTFTFSNVVVLTDDIRINYGPVADGYLRLHKHAAMEFEIIANGNVLTVMAVSQFGSKRSLVNPVTEITELYDLMGNPVVVGSVPIN